MISDTHLRDYFSKLGLEPDVASLYAGLCRYGSQSLMQLSRNTHIERTRIYRLLDILKDNFLIEEEVHDKRKIYRPAPFTNLEILFSRREQQLQDLEQEMYRINKIVKSPPIHSSSTYVHFYKGINGIKQMMWNETKGQTENLSILHENMQSRTNSTFFERWVGKCNNNRISFRGIIDDHFIATQRQWYAHHTTERLRLWQARYIPNDVYTIANCLVIYDDVVAWYDWRSNEVFGVEVHNATIAHSQRQLFEMLWHQGKPIDNLNVQPAGGRTRT